MPKDMKITGSLSEDSIEQVLVDLSELEDIKLSMNPTYILFAKHQLIDYLGWSEKEVSDYFYGVSNASR